ncbi:MAG TPA: cbb3-type cytochrome c oxidase N-terminal domain-containing protein [Polyangia bacterium]|jgi:cytochrome c oxidase cbb3-type subunit 3
MTADSDRDLLREHEYDGIQEYDNPTPGWWNLIFLGSFLFAIWYILYHHASTISLSVAQDYETDVSDDLKKRFSAIGDLKPDEPTLLKFMANDEWKLVGASVFKAQCVSCHGANAAGQIGPNLTDDYYKNVQQLTDIPKIISGGAAAGAMPAWKTRLHPNEIVLVAAYVASLRGKNLPGPRGQEGERIAPWPAPLAKP